MFWLFSLLACGPSSISTTSDTAGPGTSNDPADPTEAAFPGERVIEVDVAIDPDDWDELRVQTRTILDILGGDCLAQEFEKPWTWFEADVTVDGDLLEDVQVRKKGFLGSLDNTRPSLKVKFDAHEDRDWRGLVRLTLNNSRQDPSRLNTCLAYQVFRDAGVPAPRCSYAHVRVNGESLGLYANVESLKEGYLERTFGDASGEFWEGTLSDFRTEFLGTFEAKNDAAEDSSMASLDALRAILEDSPDETLLADLAPWIDVDDFLAFWAAEVLVAHWDGYAGNTNNFYLYRDPADDRFQFIPWGTDAVLRGPSAAVSASGILARRLYLMDETRQRYLDQLQRHLDTAWDESALLDQVNRLEDQVWEIASEDNDGFFDAVDDIRDFLETQRGNLEAEIAAGGPEWTAELRGAPCFVESGLVSASFETHWGSWTSPDPFNEGSAEVQFTWQGTSVPVSSAGAIAGDPGDGSGAIALPMTFPDNSYGYAYFNGRTELFESPGTLPVDLETTIGALYYASANTNYEFIFLGYLSGGDLVLDQSGTTNNDPVSGTVDVDILTWGW